MGAHMARRTGTFVKIKTVISAEAGIQLFWLLNQSVPNRAINNWIPPSVGMTDYVA